MLFSSVNKLAVHIIVILLIYLLLKLIPKTPLSNRDILISTVALYAIFLVVNTTKENMDTMMNMHASQQIQQAIPQTYIQSYGMASQWFAMPYIQSYGMASQWFAMARQRIHKAHGHTAPMIGL